jgi:hypothetical protein
MDVKGILTEWLISHGYDGLIYPGECSCLITDDFPCDNLGVDCTPAFRIAACKGAVTCKHSSCETTENCGIAEYCVTSVRPADRPEPHTKKLIITIEQMARMAHEVNRAYRQAIGEEPGPEWGEAPAQTKKSMLNGVIFHLVNPTAGPKNSHENWLNDKRLRGWTFGSEKNEARREHPCMVPFAELPIEQQAKDYIFRAVVHSLAALLPEV